MDFKDGLIIDAWRNSGKLYWSKIKHDNDYTWSEDIKRSKASDLVYKYSFWRKRLKLCYNRGYYCILRLNAKLKLKTNINFINIIYTYTKR